MKTPIRTLTFILTILGFAAASVSCHTLQGMGTDINQAGHAVEDAVE
ncbi:MAG: hypothetical protein R3242_02245 [Akkermansiaceae bacterium]|nr:hypothetical protein [Akkermansiaceae bacterium]